MSTLRNELNHQNSPEGHVRRAFDLDPHASCSSLATEKVYPLSAICTVDPVSDLVNNPKTCIVQALSTSVGRYIEHRLVGAVGTSRFCRRRRERGVPQRSGYDARTRWWGKVRKGVYRPVLTSRWISYLTWSTFEQLSAVRTGRAIAFLGSTM